MASRASSSWSRRSEARFDPKQLQSMIDESLQRHFSSQEQLNKEYQSFVESDLEARLQNLLQKGANFSRDFHAENATRREKEMEHWKMKLSLEERELEANCGTFIVVAADIIEGVCRATKFEGFNTENLAQKISNAVTTGRFSSCVKQYADLGGGSFMKNPVANFLSTFLSVAITNHLSKRSAPAPSQSASGGAGSPSTGNKFRSRAQTASVTSPKAPPTSSSSLSVPAPPTHGAMLKPAPIDGAKWTHQSTGGSTVPWAQSVPTAGTTTMALVKANPIADHGAVEEAKQSIEDDVVVDPVTGRHRRRLVWKQKATALNQISDTLQNFVPALGRVRDGMKVRLDIKKQSMALADLEPESMPMHG